MAISSGRYVSITSSVVPSITSSISGGGGGVTPIPPDPDPTDNWILAEGIWDDEGVWDDAKFWNDGI